MKTKEELNALKEEVKTLNKKLAELTEDELAQVSGGLVPDFSSPPVIVPPDLPVIEPPDNIILSERPVTPERPTPRAPQLVE